MSPRPPTSVEEYRLSEVEKRLAAGAGTFAAIREEVEQVRTRGNKVFAGLFVTAIGVAVAVGVLLNRVDDTATTQERHESKIEEVKEDVAEIERAQDRIGTAVETLQTTIDTKLDRALAEDPITGKRRPR